MPEETARVARATFRQGNPLLELRDELGRGDEAAWLRARAGAARTP